MSLADRVRAGEPGAIARAVSLAEAGGAAASRMLAALRDAPRQALVIGVTGAPGAGKSTLVDRLAAAYRAREARVGILAVDPSSPFTGGAILGDRVRMQGHAGDAGVFIRSMATRGQLGGLTSATANAVRILDAAGFAVVIVETVGVGQAEVDVASVADVVAVVVAPGAGDDVQALKAGLMEIADLFVVNKADRDGADRAAAAIDGALALQPPAADAWKPPVLKTVATTGDGVDELVAVIDRCPRRRRPSPGREVGGAAGAALHLDHVGIAVKDAADVAALFQRLFGVPAGEPETVADHRIRFLDARGASLELVEGLSAGSAVARFLASRGQGLHHICFRVGDLDGALARLRTLGVRLVDDVPRAGAHGSRIAFLHPASTGGILVELKECR